MPKCPTFPYLFDEVRTITIGGLRRCGYLKPDYIVRNRSIQWSDGGEPSGSVALDVDTVNKTIDLRYYVKGRFDDAARQIEYRVRLESRTSNLGKGLVWYFICPATGKRCRTLYGIGEYFLSRSAFPSAMYSIQTESKQKREFLRPFRSLDIASKHFNKPYSRTVYKQKPKIRFVWLLKKSCGGNSLNPSGSR